MDADKGLEKKLEKAVGAEKGGFAMALSTSFAAKAGGGVDGLMAQLAEAGATAVELDYRLSAGRLTALAPRLRTAGIPVWSLHNYCPIPPQASGGGGDLFSLADRDPDLRLEAVAWTIRTLEWAHELEAGAVVLHCGAVAFDHEEEVWHARYRENRLDTPEGRAFTAGKLAELRRLKAPYLDALMFSLDRLVRHAERYGVKLGLENRFHYYELPGPEDVEGLLQAFDGGPLGYWHDMGHAQAAEALGTGGGQHQLERHARQLVGIHVHDAAGLVDHLPPGEGDLDFSVLGPFFASGARLVLELQPGTAPSAAAAGARHVEAAARRLIGA